MSGKIWRDVFYCIAVILFGILIYLVLNNHDGQWIMLLGTFISLVAARFDDLAKFKLSKDGLEGEMRQVIDEAKATLEQLHSVAETQSRMILWSMQAHGRWSGLNLQDQNQMRDAVVSNLKALRLPEAKIEHVLSVEYPYIDHDYATYVARGLNHGLKEDKLKAWNEFYSPDVRKGIGYQPTPDELEKFLASLNLISDEVKERLEDYRYFLKTRKHRRPEEWMKSRN